jgi:hypothetical protein
MTFERGIMIEAEVPELPEQVTVSFMLIHPGHPDIYPIIKNWPIPRVGEYVSLSTPSPFWSEGLEEGVTPYLDMSGFVRAVKHDFYDQELPNGNRVSRNTAKVLLVPGDDPFKFYGQ